jgi:tripartite-type tricarboxylate transporter receptor subunit TctC
MGNTTKISRRNFLQQLAAGAVVFPTVPRLAWAQAYPTRPVRLIVPYTPGGGTDITARLIGQWLSDRLGQPFVIENRPGAATNIGTEAVVKAAPDGYTLLLFDPAAATNATYYDKLNFSFIRDIAPVAGVTRGPFVMLVNPAFPAKTVAEFIALTKANPSRVNMASPGSGTLNHLSGEMLNAMAGISMLHVPYRGSAPALTDLLGGQVQVMFTSVASSIEYIRAGKLRALAVTTAIGSEELPGIPTVDNFVPGYETINWYGIGAPKGTPAEIINRINAGINAALADPAMKARFADLGGTVFPGSPADLGKFIAAETERWRTVMRAGNIKAE